VKIPGLEAAKRTVERIKSAPGIRFVLAVNDRYSRDDGGLLAGALTFYGFLSLFPLLLLGLSVLGFVLAAHPSLHHTLTTKLTGSVPGIGSIIGSNLRSVESSRAGTGVVGLVGLAWSGTGIVSAAEGALARVFGFRTAGGWQGKAWQLGTLVVLGVLALVTTAVAGLAGGLHANGTVLAVAVRVGGTVVAWLAGTALFLVSYRVLGERRGPGWRALLPGAAFAGAGWTALQVIGSWYARRTVTNASAVFGTFATTVGLLVLLNLGARLFMYGAEGIAVLRGEGGSHVETADRSDHRRTRVA